MEKQYSYRLYYMLDKLRMERAEIVKETPKQTRIGSGSSRGHGWKTNVDPAEVYKTESKAIDVFICDARNEILHMEEKIAKLHGQINAAKDGRFRREWESKGGDRG